MKQELPILDLAINQENFIKIELLELLGQLSDQSKPLWGMMTAQHMVEHLIFIFENSSGVREIKLLIPEDKLPKYVAFLRSNYGFTRNFKFAMLPENELVSLRYDSLEESLEALEENIKMFFEYINAVNFSNTIHPYYGSLNKEDSILFQYKHAMHHLMQFGLK